MLHLLLSVLAGSLLCGAQGQEWLGNYYCVGNRDVVVHLFEWRWDDIAQECTDLAAMGYCAVQVSPPNEHIVLNDATYTYPWWQRYQPVSYKLDSRSGDEAAFINMVQTCNNQGVFIYVDAVINHMTGGGSGTGSAGSWWSGDEENFPAVPFDQQNAPNTGSSHFHGTDACHTGNLEIGNFNDINEVRNCRLLGLRDLRGSLEWVQSKIAEFMNRLIDIGVAGFRLDAAKHMWPQDITDTFRRLNNLNAQWFPEGTRPYIFQEVIEMGDDMTVINEYLQIGRVTEFRHGLKLSDVFQRLNAGQHLANLANYGEGWGLMAPLSALVFIDNHDNQRGHGGGGNILTFRSSKKYKMANAFQLAWKYGHVRIMSSYDWSEAEGDWVGPPSDPPGVTKPAFNNCFNEWICEHRWRQIANMVRFHNVVLGEPVQRWWDNGFHEIAFSRGNKGFIVFNNENHILTRTFDTGLPDGMYCDVYHCDNNRPPCGTGDAQCREIEVRNGGWADITVVNGDDPVTALHV